MKKSLRIFTGNTGSYTLGFANRKPISISFDLATVCGVATKRNKLALVERKLGFRHFITKPLNLSPTPSMFTFLLCAARKKTTYSYYVGAAKGF